MVNNRDKVVTKGIAKINPVNNISADCLSSVECKNNEFCYNSHCHPAPRDKQAKYALSYVNRNISVDHHLLRLYNDRFILIPALYQLTNVKDIVEVNSKQFIVLADNKLYLVDDKPIYLEECKATQLFIYNNIIHKVEDNRIYQRLSSNQWYKLIFIGGRDISKLSINRVRVPLNPITNDIVIITNDNHRYSYINDIWTEDIISAEIDFKYGISIEESITIRGRYINIWDLPIIDVTIDSLARIFVIDSTGIYLINGNNTQQLIGSGVKLISTFSYVWLISGIGI